MEPAKYNLGCGKDVRDGYVNVDARELPGVVRGNVGHPGWLTDQFGPPEEVLMLDVIEHFSWREADSVLQRWCEALVPGGTIYVQCPNMKRFAKILLNCSSANLDKIRSDIFGGQDYSENTHHTFFTVERLTDIMEECGLEVTEIKRGIKLHVRGKEKSTERSNEQ